MASSEGTNRPQGNPKKSRTVRFSDATQGPQDSAVKFIRGLEHDLNTLALAPPAPGVGGSFDRQHRGPSLPSIGPVPQAHAGATQPDIGSIPSTAVDGFGSTSPDDDKTPTPSRTSSVQPPQPLSVPTADKRLGQGPSRNPSFPMPLQQVQLEPPSSRQPPYEASGPTLWSPEVLQQRLSSFKSSDFHKVGTVPGPPWWANLPSAGSAAHHHGQQSYSGSRASRTRATTSADNSAPTSSWNREQKTLPVPASATTESSIQFLQPDETPADNMSARDHTSATTYVAGRSGSQPIGVRHAESVSSGSGSRSAVTAPRRGQLPAVVPASVSTPTIPILASEDKGPIDRDDTTPRPMDFSHNSAHLTGPPMSGESGSAVDSGRLREDPILPDPRHRSTHMQMAEPVGSMRSTDPYPDSTQAGSDASAHQPQQPISPDLNDVRSTLNAKLHVSEKKALESEDEWTPVTRAKNRRSRQSATSSPVKANDERPSWLKYYPPTIHTPGAKASRYNLGNVYIHVMKGERFTPASASKLVTGHVTDKPRPCFLTWWDEGPEDVIYLAPLLGAIPPAEWQEIGINSNLHVLGQHTWRDRWCSAEWSPHTQSVLRRNKDRVWRTKLFAPSTPQHPNERTSLRPKITIRWEDSPEEHPLKSSFIWAGDPGEAIDLTGLTTIEQEEAVVGPFAQYCHLDLPELWKLHHWWKHMYAADPASIAPQAR